MRAFFHTSTLREHLQAHILRIKLSTINKSTPLYCDTTELNKGKGQLYGILRLSFWYRAVRHKMYHCLNAPEILKNIFFAWGDLVLIETEAKDLLLYPDS